MEQSFFDLIYFLHCPGLTETFLDVLLSSVPIWLAVMISLVIGRLPNTKRLNLEAVGVELDEMGAVKKTVFGGQPTKPDYSNVPCAVFCIPPLCVVGLSEEEAIEQAKGDISIFTSTFNPMKNTVSGRQEKKVMKLVVDFETDKVIGASMCGPDAPEIMQINHQELEGTVKASEEVGRNENVCTLCEEFAAKAIEYLEDNKTQTEMIDILHNTCARLIPIEQKCITLVDYYVTLLFSEIELLQPEDFCQTFYLCEQRVLASQSLAEDKCEIFHLAISEVIVKLKDPDTQVHILPIIS
ncbi:hypothetical protein HYC85_012829 [Camellia sinensis]|uniref:Saposin B-type domain-containing protein n=1 Tax=Camellia sinensis TaxID=4442 RepID=A0A7J7HG77_CAMSI|nr:hypothetical protein HYC85_012829 [Camellia sinensis]